MTDKVDNYLQKHPRITLQAYYKDAAYIVGLYDNERGNHIAGGHAKTILESMEQAVARAEKAEA